MMELSGDICHILFLLKSCSLMRLFKCWYVLINDRIRRITSHCKVLTDRQFSALYKGTN